MMQNLVELMELIDESSRLHYGTRVTIVHENFNCWVKKIGDWLLINASNKGAAFEWKMLSKSPLVVGGRYYDSTDAMAKFYEIVEARCNWLKKLAVSETSSIEKKDSQILEVGNKSILLSFKPVLFCNLERLAELKNCIHPDYDFQKLLRLCEELNVCFACGSFMATAMVTRAILDHVPPLFQCKTFGEVANNVQGSKSFRESMKNLDESARKVADSYLHVTIRKNISLPNETQVNCMASLDVLLGEIASRYRV